MGMGKTKEQEKKKTLEDIISVKTFNKIVETANFLREIETIGKTDAEHFWKHSTAASANLSELFSKYKLDESHYHQLNRQISDMQEHLRIKSELESVICVIENGKPTYKRKKRGLFKTSYSLDYLIASLAAELKRITGKANYGILQEYLCRLKSKEDLPLKEDLPQMIRRSKPLMIHIKEALKVHKPLLYDYLKKNS